MSQAQDGNTVKVHYTGKLEDGTVFDSSVDRDPLEFKMGAKQMIPGFEKGVHGMKLNDKKTVTIPPEEAYGIRHDHLAAKFPIEQFPPNIKPEVGQKLQLKQENGQPLTVTVTEVTDKEVSLDANHHLAGKTLIFDIELVELNQ
ncbi:MAG TPA: peptidylprolyl isomerase [Victivallales bacterium]|nr:peptidylprolyl isomerase [Victivallales bacterium]